MPSSRQRQAKGPLPSIAIPAALPSRARTCWNETGLITRKREGCPSRFLYVRHRTGGSVWTRHEQAYLLAKGHPRKPADPPSDILDWRYTGNKLHPTQKPVEALLPLIEAYSRRGEVVLDPFAGSGTTTVAARQLNRRPIGIEMDWGYCCVANERLIQGGE